MGSQPAKSRYLYEVDENFNLNQTDYFVTFNKKYSFVGAFRYCYEGKIKSISGKSFIPESFSNGKCVVKVLKKSIALDVFELYTDFKNYFYAKKVTEIFNTKYTDQIFSYKLNYVTPYVTSLKDHASFNLLNLFSIRNSDQMKIIKENEWIIIEPFIEGNYEKFANNAGKVISVSDKIIPFFMHWNWVYSKGEKLVSDIQGVKKFKYYELTDPAILSINVEYGPSDLGSSALIMFLSNHQHNEYCSGLPWPNYDDMQKIQYYSENLENYLYFYGYVRPNEYKDVYIKIINSTFREFNSLTTNIAFNWKLFLFLLLFLLLAFLFFIFYIFRRNKKKRIYKKIINIFSK